MERRRRMKFVEYLIILDEFDEGLLKFDLNLAGFLKVLKLIKRKGNQFIELVGNVVFVREYFYNVYLCDEKIFILNFKFTYIYIYIYFLYKLIFKILIGILKLYIFEGIASLILFLFISIVIFL